jgi:hypothetical protein
MLVLYAWQELFAVYYHLPAMLDREAVKLQILDRRVSSKNKGSENRKKAAHQAVINGFAQITKK